MSVISVWRSTKQAFVEARDCVIVSTSALELGVDVGDLDRVIQVNSPSMVAAFLQRPGRSGRRPGTTRNCLFLALDENEFLHAAGLLLAWSSLSPTSPHFTRPVRGGTSQRLSCLDDIASRALLDIQYCRKQTSLSWRI